ncbi:hypothetical protein K7711_15840 [Nocardia sp. CA2R105]|uniref:hypothetical protein n=1 Tax=Nocardia coffeae TaxID=2873381 RepID=UPI001CA67A01|nr:hypothetical protein [Nocardia coffeae]MBY8857957.1 hypothetical protein [Nocardia coffeae]
MLGELASLIARDLVMDRVDRYVERRQERKGKFGVPVVTSVAAIIGTVATVGWLLVNLRFEHSDGVPTWIFAVPGARLALVLLVAYGLRPGGTARRGGRWYFAMVFAEIANLVVVMADVVGLIAVGLADLVRGLNAISPAGGVDLGPKWLGLAQTALIVVALLADAVVGLALLIRRRALEPS